MAAPITALTASLQCLLTFNAQQTVTGLTKGIRNNDQVTPTATFSVTGAAVANGANQAYSAITSIGAGSSTTIDLSAALTNIVGSSTATFARLKAILIELVSTAQDSTNGTACTSITFGAAASNQFITQSSGRGFLGTTTSTHDVPNGGFYAFGVDNAAGVLVDSTHKSLKILNNDGAVPAAVRITLIGADA